MLIDYALSHDLLEEKHLSAINPHQANLRVAWVFSRFMQPWPGSDGTSVNRLMNVFCKALGDVGERTTLRFLQDRYTFVEYLRIMLTTARHYPGVFGLTTRVLGPWGLIKWGSDIASFASDDFLRMVYGKIGSRLWKRMEKSVEKSSPSAALRLMARRSVWQATR